MTGVWYDIELAEQLIASAKLDGTDRAARLQLLAEATAPRVPYLQRILMCDQAVKGIAVVGDRS